MLKSGVEESVLKEVVTLSNCESEPIHRLGQIQSFGFLLAFDREGVLVACSDNIQTLFDKSTTELLEQPFPLVLPPGLAILLADRLTIQRAGEQVERFFNVIFSEKFPAVDIALHYFGERWIMEFEPTVSEPSVEPVELARKLVSTIRLGPQTLEHCCETAVRLLKRLTGFDRVMIYRFDDDGSGEVIAEACEDHLERFLGLHYPAADIPDQARILYTKNLLRFIVDIGDTSSRIVGIRRETSDLDLTKTSLRSVSSIHVEYLRNMGVRASMSVSILRDGKLWGLFALHHYAPRLISVERRVAAELFGELFNPMLVDLERKHSLQCASFGEHLAHSGEWRDGDPHQILLTVANQIQELVPCDGVWIAWKESEATVGLSPGAGQMKTLLENSRKSGAQSEHETNELAEVAALLNDPETQIAGVLGSGVSETAVLKIALFRKEALSHIRWAGNPEKTYDVGPNGPRLCPRESFAEWSELIRGKSLPWTAREKRSLSLIRATLSLVLNEAPHFT